MSRVRWHGNRVLRDVEKQLKIGGLRAGAMLEGEAKRLVSKRGAPAGSSAARVHSLPGEPPRLQQGTLRSNISHEVRLSGKKLHVFLGVLRGPANPYGRRLELGYAGVDAAGRNVQQAPRPYLRPTLTRHGERALRLLVK